MAKSLAPSPRRRTPHPPRYAVILAGGHGHRFWPRSRRRVPKHLLPIAGRATLLQQTVRRLAPIVSSRRVLIVTSADHAAEVRRQLPALDPAQVLVEPVGRNTLPAIALAAGWIRAREEDATMVVAPADHVIRQVGGLRRDLRAACTVAERADLLVTLGVVPTRPEPGYGYLEVGTVREGLGARVHTVRAFREKPSLVRARQLLRGGRHLWNAGIFVWSLATIEAALARHAAPVADALRGVWVGPRTRVAGRIRRAYAAVPSVSIDVGVMEPAAAARTGPGVAVIRAGFDWNDVGSWASMPELWGGDTHGNAAVGKLVAVDAAEAIVYAPERLVALVGVRDVIVVDSPDALLICARERSQDVRRVIHELQRHGWTQYL